MRPIGSFLAIVLISTLFLIAYHICTHHEKTTKTTKLTETINTINRKNIFFIETKFDKFILTPRESCSIESAANKHINSIVTVYNINGNFDMSNENVKRLSTIPNVRLKFINLTEAFSDTPLATWYKSDAIKNSIHPTEHMSDALRIALLYKNGGIYSDTDSITIRPLDQLRNTVSDQGDNSLGNGVLIFDKDSEILLEYMTTFANNFRGDLWSYQGPEMLDALVKKRCNVENLNLIYNKPEECAGITVKPVTALFFVHYTQYQIYYSNDSTFAVDESETFAVHLFGRMSRNISTKVGNGSFIDRLFRQHCPLNYQLMLKEGAI
ncbi:hypothetical protein CHUAL_008417 [Chamberlinius hualienensis]